MRKRELVERLEATETRFSEVNDNLIHVSESLAELEEYRRERIGWHRLGGFDGREFSRDFLRTIYDEALPSYIKNPLINHGVEVQGHYVFGQGVEIVGQSPEVDKLWQLFWDQPSNRVEFTSYQALFLKEVDLQLEGNLFLALFTAPRTGAVKIRSIHSNEIADIITNPEDSKDPWFYKRAWTEKSIPRVAMTGSGMNQMEAYYPAWNYRPKIRPTTMLGKKINWDAPIYHVKVGGTSFMRFGVTEIYSALDWARATKEAMEDYATVRSVLARWAHQLLVKGGKEGVAEAKRKIGTTIGESTGETNPSPIPGSTFLGAEGQAKLEVLRTSGAQSHPDEARMLTVLAGAGLGKPYAILTGDADKSNLATAKSLDRPTELSMNMRRMLWTMIFQDINTYLLMASIRASSGVVKGKLVADEWGTERVVIKGTTEADPKPTGLKVEWPPILEHDKLASINSIIKAATLDGKTEAGILDRETLIRQLASVLGIEDIDDVIANVLEEAEEKIANAPPAEDVTQEAQFVEVLKEVQGVLKDGQD